MANAGSSWLPLLVQVWFDRMLGYRIAADIVAYNAFIAACAGQGKVAKAEELLTEARATCLSPDLVTYNTLLHAWARSATHQEPVYVSRKMSIFVLHVGVNKSGMLAININE